MRPMSNHDEPHIGPDEDHAETSESPETIWSPVNDQQQETEVSETPEKEEQEKHPGLIERAKKLYEEQPVHFAVGVIGVSGLLFLLGGIVSGDLSFGAL